MVMDRTTIELGIQYDALKGIDDRTARGMPHSGLAWAKHGRKAMENGYENASGNAANARKLRVMIESSMNTIT